MKNFRIVVYFSLFFVFLMSALPAEPLLPHLFSDHMVGVNGDPRVGQFAVRFTF